MSLLEILAEFCAPCTGSPPVPGSGPGSIGAAAGVGSPPTSSGPGPGRRGSPPGPDVPGQGGPGAPTDPAGPTGPSGDDIARSVAESTAIEAGADAAGIAAGRAGSSGISAKLLGVLGTVVAGSQTAAEGYVAVSSSKGRGLGGGSRAADQAFEAIANERANNQRLAEQMRSNR